MTWIRFVTGKSSGILSGIASGILPGIWLLAYVTGISSGIPSGISSNILSGISSGILSGIYLTFYLAYLLAFYLAVEVQRCTLSWERSQAWGPAVHAGLGRWLRSILCCTLTHGTGPRLRSSGAHWAGKVTRLRSVQRCTLSWEGHQVWGPAVHTRETGGGGGGGGGGQQLLIKSINPHLARWRITKYIA